MAKAKTRPSRPEWDHSWKSYTFQYISKSDGIQEKTLVVNPESYSQTEPARITVTQTKGGMFVDSFGEGIKTIVISGTMGYKRRIAVGGPGPEQLSGPGTEKSNKQREGVSGQDQFLDLRKLYRDWLLASTDPNEKAQMRFYNWSDEESYEVVITQFSLQRATGRPLLYQYNIQMTCIKDLNAKQQGDADPITDKLSEPTGRATIVYDKLDTNTTFLKGLINGLGVGTFSESVTKWAGAASKGSSFFNTVTNTFKTVQSAIDDVQDLSDSVGLFVAGANTFINTPFDLVKQTATTLEDLIENCCSVGDIPHEVVRSLRETVCAITSLSKSLFSGFTNPGLFEGASNCGTTLGVLDSLLLGTHNSFSATAQKPPQVVKSQIFDVPTSVMKLNDEPLRVSGVYLETDIERTGINYLNYSSGSNVTLSSVPITPVVVDYSLRQDTTQNLIKYESSSSYTVISGDTLTRIALKFYGDPGRWKEIALYNNLEYPYISDDYGFEKEIVSTGTVRFYRATGTTDPVSIPKDHLVWVPAYQGTNAINFRVTAETTLVLSAPYVDVLVHSEIEGPIGNVWPGAITGFTAITGISSVYNLSSIIGGKVWRLALVGETIQIPMTSKEATSAVNPTQPGYEELFGIDIWVDDSGEFDFSVDQSTDFARVFGTKNLVQALQNRIKTTKGYYPYNSEYGTNLPLYIGRKGLPNQYDMIKVDIKNGVLMDPRLSGIKSFLMTVDGDEVQMSFDAIPIGEQNLLPINIVI
jgi:hypothetical protein